jgi:fructose-1,6-bisphosphatase
MGKTGRDIVAAGLAVYGSRTSALIDSDGKVNEYSLVKSKVSGANEWITTIENIKISEKAKFFSPGNLRAANENLEYKQLIDYWISKNFTLRLKQKN